MKKLLIVASCVAIAACGEAAAPEVEEVVEEVAEAEGSGTFAYAAEDGSFSGQTTMNEDGTFTDVASDGTETTGTWRAGDGQTCFTGSEEGAEEACWTDGEPGEDGSFTSTSADGVVVKVTPVAEEAEADAEETEDAA